MMEQVYFDPIESADRHDAAPFNCEVCGLELWPQAESSWALAPDGEALCNACFDDLTTFEGEAA